MKKKKARMINLPMEFNPGTQKYEPELPLKLSNKKRKIDINWFGLFIIMLIITLGMLFLYFYLV